MEDSRVLFTGGIVSSTAGCSSSATSSSVSSVTSSVDSSTLFVSSVTVRGSGNTISLSCAPAGKNCSATDSSRSAKPVITSCVFAPLSAVANTVRSMLVNNSAVVRTNATPRTYFLLFSFFDICIFKMFTSHFNTLKIFLFLDKV